MTGKKFDTEKPPIDLVRPEFIEGIARVLAFGAKKYDAWNWAGGIDYSRLYAAQQRHVMAWNKGEDLDPETGENHLLHAACELMFLYCFQEWGKDELDDRFKPKTSSPPLSPSRESSYLQDPASLGVPEE